MAVMACSLLSYAGPSHEITRRAPPKILDMTPTLCMRSRASDRSMHRASIHIHSSSQSLGGIHSSMVCCDTIVCRRFVRFVLVCCRNCHKFFATRRSCPSTMIKCEGVGSPQACEIALRPANNQGNSQVRQSEPRF